VVVVVMMMIGQFLLLLHRDEMMLMMIGSCGGCWRSERWEEGEVVGVVQLGGSGKLV
jgi:hypothetical protein